MKRRILPLTALFLLALAAGAAFAQSFDHPATPAPAAAHAGAPARAASTPALDDKEQLRLENFQLRAQNLQQSQQLLQQQQHALQQDVGAFLEAVNAEHPGYLFNPNTGQFAAAPPTPKAEPKPAAAKTTSGPQTSN